ncbi:MULTISPECIES: helix-turn-helix domain-containing protein [unclassified Thioalkalivibrio]|uniref:helix-turn-helix domain-containing protein n=1 Tax=unclassified Thioalkalivibrio TaxID=2621013 RepID=UPI0003812632|nr:MULTISPECIES: helix-turn-helix domain-containing protein [unclassified Thioalkalivibrio]
MDAPSLEQEQSGEPVSSGNLASGCVLAESVRNALDQYFETLDGQSSHDLYALVMNEVERPLLACVLERCNGNQSRAAALLGLNRATLRKKLRAHGLISENGHGNGNGNGAQR